MPRDWKSVFSHPETLDFSPDPLLVANCEMLAPGRALDLACGHGRNAIYLGELGWQVTALDREEAAIGLLREHSAGLNIDARVCDLEDRSFAIEPFAFDLICDFLYLDRKLFPQIREGVKPGGTFIGVMLLANEEKGSFHLEPGELREAFAGWKILFYSESAVPGKKRDTARIVARRA
jgi:tellurite methyltransferase